MTGGEKCVCGHAAFNHEHGECLAGRWVKADVFRFSWQQCACVGFFRVHR